MGPRGLFLMWRNFPERLAWKMRRISLPNVLQWKIMMAGNHHFSSETSIASAWSRSCGFHISSPKKGMNPIHKKKLEPAFAGRNNRSSSSSGVAFQWARVKKEAFKALAHGKEAFSTADGQECLMIDIDYPRRPRWSIRHTLSTFQEDFQKTFAKTAKVLETFQDCLMPMLIIICNYVHIHLFRS